MDGSRNIEVEHAEGYTFTKKRHTGYEFLEYCDASINTPHVGDEVKNTIAFVVDKVYKNNILVEELYKEDWDFVIYPVYLQAVKALVPKLPAGSTTDQP